MAPKPDLTALQEAERLAMCGDRSATLVLVTAVRGFRELLDVIEAEYESNGETFYDHKLVWEEIEGEA